MRAEYLTRLQGENAWVFVNEEVIADSVKAYRKFNEKLLEKYPKEKRKDMKPTEITGWLLFQLVYLCCNKVTLSAHLRAYMRHHHHDQHHCQTIFGQIRS